MTSTKRQPGSRLAVLGEWSDGLLQHYLCSDKLFVAGDEAATAHNIITSERLFRLGIAAEVICAVEFIYLLWVFYRLLSGVSRTHASLIVIFGVAFVPIMCINAVSGIAALAVARCGLPAGA